MKRFLMVAVLMCAALGGCATWSGKRYAGPIGAAAPNCPPHSDVYCTGDDSE